MTEQAKRLLNTKELQTAWGADETMGILEAQDAKSIKQRDIEWVKSLARNGILVKADPENLEIEYAAGLADARALMLTPAQVNGVLTLAWCVGCPNKANRPMCLENCPLKGVDDKLQKQAQSEVKQ